MRTIKIGGSYVDVEKSEVDRLVAYHRNPAPHNVMCQVKGRTPAGEYAVVDFYETSGVEPHLKWYVSLSAVPKGKVWLTARDSVYMTEKDAEKWVGLLTKS